MWHDPLVGPGRTNGQAKQPAEETEERNKDAPQRRASPPRRRGARIIAGPAEAPDPAELERLMLLDHVLLAQGRPAITAATESYLKHGHELPQTQDVLLQLLEHNDEERVFAAIEGLTALLEEEDVQRRAVLDSRLRRIEEYADEATTRQAATTLRRQLGNRSIAPQP